MSHTRIRYFPLRTDGPDGLFAWPKGGGYLTAAAAAHIAGVATGNGEEYTVYKRTEVLEPCSVSDLPLTAETGEAFDPVFDPPAPATIRPERVAELQAKVASLRNAKVCAHTTQALDYIDETLAEIDRLRNHIIDIDAHATPFGDIPGDPGWVGSYLVSAGALHRALGTLGHSSPSCAAEAEVKRLRGEVEKAHVFYFGPEEREWAGDQSYVTVDAHAFCMCHAFDVDEGWTSEDFDGEQDARRQHAEHVRQILDGAA